MVSSAAVSRFACRRLRRLPNLTLCSHPRRGWTKLVTAVFRQNGSYCTGRSPSSVTKPKPYHQKAYVICPDLGEAGALFTRGWERKVEMVGDMAKKTKREINTVWIYPPRPERAAALAPTRNA